MELQAQLNLKIGYDLNRFSSTVIEEMTRSFNEVENPFLANGKELPELQYLNGLTIGVSYKTKVSRLEIGWQTSARTRKAFGEKPATMTEAASSFETEMRYRISGFYVSSEFILGRFGLGATLGNDAFRMTTDIVSSSNDKIILNEIIYGASVHLSYQLYQSENIALVLRPYFKKHLKTINYTEIYDFLDLSEVMSLVDRPYSVGISVIFYNGRQ